LEDNLDTLYIDLFQFLKAVIIPNVVKNSRIIIQIKDNPIPKKLVDTIIQDINDVRYHNSFKEVINKTFLASIYGVTDNMLQNMYNNDDSFFDIFLQNYQISPFIPYIGNHHILGHGLFLFL